MGARAGVTTSSSKSSRTSASPRWLNAALLIVAAISLFLAQSATWISRTIFDQQTFTTISTNVLLSEQSRNDLAGIIVDKSLENYPTINNLVGNNLQTLVSGLLGTDIASSTLTDVVSRSYGYLTASDREDISINLSGIREPLTTIASTLEENGHTVQIDPSQIPSEITLLRSDEIPDLSPYIRTTLVANLLFWILAALCFTVYIYLNRTRTIRALYMVTGTIALVAIIGLITGPFVPPIMATFINAIPVRRIAVNLIDAFLHPFYGQLLFMLAAAAIFALCIRLQPLFVDCFKRLTQHLTTNYHK